MTSEDEVNTPAIEGEKNFEEIAIANFEMWNEALQTKDPRKVAELYTKDATFLPTVSGELKRGIGGAEGYFKHFLEKDPIGKITEAVVQKIDEKSFLHIGKYDFEVGPQDDRKTLHARFTFLWQLDENGEWKIAHHHSSFNPEN